MERPKKLEDRLEIRSFILKRLDLEYSEGAKNLLELPRKWPKKSSGAPMANSHSTERTLGERKGDPNTRTRQEGDGLEEIETEKGLGLICLRRKAKGVG